VGNLAATTHVLLAAIVVGGGVLILLFSGLALYHAIGRRIDAHRRWALRLFMVASAVWFFRVGLMGWIMLTGGVGIDFESFTGPFLYVLGFAPYLLPLAFLQWYFRTRQGVSDGETIALALALTGASLFMAVGIFAATLGMGLPRL